MDNREHRKNIFIWKKTREQNPYNSGNRGTDTPESARERQMAMENYVPNDFFYLRSSIVLTFSSAAYAQRKFVEVVLYLKIISSPTLTSVESFMLVSGIAQSWLLAT